jgi:hypothetical protein
MRLLTFKVFTDAPAADLPVEQWQPGLTAAPEACLGHYLNGTLRRLGFDADRPEGLRTSLLVADWNGHPRRALVVATGVGRLPGEPFAVSDQPADPAC